MGDLTSFTQESKYLNKTSTLRWQKNESKGTLLRLVDSVSLKHLRIKKVPWLLIVFKCFKQVCPTCSTQTTCGHMGPWIAVIKFQYKLNLQTSLKYYEFSFSFFTNFYNLIAQNFRMKCIGDSTILSQCKISGHTCKRIVNPL